MGADVRWTKGDLEGLLDGNETPWSKVLLEIERLAAYHGRRRRLAPSEQDEVYGSVLMLLLRRSCHKIRSCHTPASFGHYLNRLIRDSAAKVAARNAARRPQLETDARRLDLTGSDGVGDLREFVSRVCRPRPERRSLSPLLAMHARHLTPLQFEVVWRRELLDWTWNDVAQSMGRTRDATRKAYARALTTIRRNAKG